MFKDKQSKVDSEYKKVEKELMEKARKRELEKKADESKSK